MIKGCLNLGKNAHHAQGNNVQEILDGPALTKCNDTAIVNLWAAVTLGYDKWTNPFGGQYRGWQPEDLVDLYFHDEDNWPGFRLVRNLALTHYQTDDVHGPYQSERIPQYHKLALQEVFGLGAEFFWGASFDTIMKNVTNGIGAILRLKKPGHFVTAVCYDDQKKLIGFRDPAPVKWLQETQDAELRKWMSPDDFRDNIESDYTLGWRL